MLVVKIESEELLFRNQTDLDNLHAYCEHCHGRYEVRPGVGRGRRRPCRDEFWNTKVKDEVILECLHCGKDFCPKTMPSYHQRSTQLFCSQRCSSSRKTAGRIAAIERQKIAKDQRLVTTTCKKCKRQFRHSPKQSREYCTKRCAMQAIGAERANKIRSSCFTCGKEILLPNHRLKSTRQFCSRKCANANRTKPKSKSANCLVCGREFLVPPSYRQKYCSQKCSAENKRKQAEIRREKAKVDLKCKNCLQTFRVSPKEAEEGRQFCSAVCQKEYSPKITTNCAYCGKEFSDFAYNFHKRRRRYCSNSCSAKDHPRVRLLPPTYPPEFNEEFKEKIRRRDNYQCVLCGKLGKDVHHINYDKSDTRMENCVFLCRKCHTKTNFKRDKWIPVFTRIIDRYRLGLSSL